MFSRCRGRSALVLLVLALAGGCGPKIKTYPVTGKVTYPDGTPVPGGTVEFESTGQGGEAVNAHGTIQPDGTFRMKTVLEKKELDGAVEGPQKVVVVPPPYDAVGDKEPPPPPFNRRYADYNKSGLTFEVKAGPNEYSITVEK